MEPPAATVELAWATRCEAPQGRVFTAITEGRHIARWFCHEAEVEPRLGGRLVLRWRRPGAVPFEGRWLEFAPPRLCAYDGGHPGYPQGYAGVVRFTLERDGEDTVLHTVHVLPAGPAYEPFVAEYREAWPRALARLQAYLSPE